MMRFPRYMLSYQGSKYFRGIFYYRRQPQHRNSYFNSTLDGANVEITFLYKGFNTLLLTCYQIDVTVCTMAT